MVAPRIHPWHDIPAGHSVPDVLTAVIEIPRNERNKYELDKALGLYRLDRVLHSAVHYPGDYGFIPRTLGDDGDPLDVLVMMTQPAFTGCLVEVRPLGVFRLVDRGDMDEKVIAVPLNDPYSKRWKDLEDIPSHALREIEHFFQVYKDLEGTSTRSKGFENAESAREVILDAVERYGKMYGAGGKPKKPARRKASKRR